MKLRLLFTLFLALAVPALTYGEIKIGIIGTDTSHVTAFTKLLNDASHKDYVPGGKVIAAFKGGSPDIESSWKRVDGYAKELNEKYGVKIVDSIEELCAMVDAVLLESVDGRPHLEQVKPVFKARKPVYIDKPVAGSLRDAIEIYRLAKEYNVPCFSSSSLRYYPGLVELQKTDVGEIKGAFSTGPCSLEPHHPDLFWYGIHPTEALFTIMGTGCQTVTATVTGDTHLVTGVWEGGKVATLRGIRNANAPYRVTVFGAKGVVDQKPGGDYAPLVREIMQFFKTGVAPVSAEETLEIFAFMEAADESKRKGGCPVKIADVMKKAGAKKVAKK